MASSEFREEPITTPQVTAPIDRKYSSWFVVELEHLLKDVPAHVRQATIEEVEEHLRCSRLALEEIGIDPNECDKEAVKRFGTPAALANQVIDGQRAPQKPNKVLGYIMAATAIYVCSFGMFLYYNITALFIGAAVGIIAFTYLSWKERVFQWKSLAKTGLCITVGLGLTLGFTWVEFWSSGGSGVSPKWAMADEREGMQSQLIEVSKELAECNPVYKVFKKGQSTVEASPYYSNGSYRTFTPVYSKWGPWTTTSYHPGWTTNYIDAAESWRLYEGVRSEWDREQMDSPGQIAAIDQTMGRVFDPGPALSGIAMGAGFSCVAILLNFFVYLLRSLFDAVKRFPKRLAA